MFDNLLAPIESLGISVAEELKNIRTFCVDQAVELVELSVGADQAAVPTVGDQALKQSVEYVAIDPAPKERPASIEALENSKSVTDPAELKIEASAEELARLAVENSFAE